MPTASATDQYGSGCRNRQPVSHHGTRTAPTPPVTTNQAALVITAADLRITIHPLGPPGRYRHRVASRRGGRSRYAFRGSPTMAWIGGHGLSPTTAHVAIGVCLCSVSCPLLAQEFSTTYSSGSMSSPVTAWAGQCSAWIATHCAPRRGLRASWLCSRRSGLASRSSSDLRASIGFLGRYIASSRLASGCNVAANAPVSPEVRSSGVTDPLDPCQRRNSQSAPSEAWVVTPRRIHVVPPCRVMHNVRAPGGAGQNERDDQAGDPHHHEDDAHSGQADPADRCRYRELQDRSDRDQYQAGTDSHQPFSFLGFVDISRLPGPQAISVSPVRDRPRMCSTPTSRSARFVCTRCSWLPRTRPRKAERNLR